MRVLATGHHGYIRSVIVGILSRAGHAVTGPDTDSYEGCNFGDQAVAPR